MSGITFSVINNNTNAVTVNGTSYAKGKTVMTLEIKWNATNKRWEASTGNVLPYGTYTIKENPMSGNSSLANNNYFLNSNTGSVTIKANAVTYTATFKNTKATYDVSIAKSINAGTTCTNGIKNNPLYSLAGAKYGVYINGVLQETLTTDANGKATGTKKYNVGTVLTIKETQAPSGYVLDTATYTHTIVHGTNNVAVKDVPVFSELLSLFKQDNKTGNSQGNTSFEGVVFKWEYFPNYDWSGTAERTWYLKTDANGRVYQGDAYLADGYESDNFYLDASSYRRLPLGSLKITEVVPPAGYAAVGPLYCTITQSASGSSTVNINWTDASKELVEFRSDPENYNLLEPVANLGGFSIQKRDSVTGTTPQGGATLAGAKFQVINNSTNSVKIGSFAEAEKGEVCYEFTVDSTGKFSSGKIFPIGSYIVKEVTAPTGYRLNSTYQGTFTVTGGNTTSLTCSDTVIKGGIKIVKQDADLGSSTTQNQDLSGITFSVINANTNPVVVNSKTYAKDAVIMTLTLAWDDTAKQWTASTGTVLPYGTYTLREEPMSGSTTLANSHYLLNANLGTVNVKGNGVTYTATYKNTRASFQVTVSKSMNATTGCINQIKDNSMYSLAGAKYGIYINGVLQETLTTNVSGKATSAKKYDLGTQITVKEITAPTGFVLDTTEYNHTIVEGTNSVAVKDVPVFSDFMSLYKVDKDTTNAQGNTTFQGVVFKWEYFENYDWSGTAARTWYLKTDANGRVYMTAEHKADGYESDDFYLDAGSYRRLPIGSLKITEIAPPTGYAAVGPIYCTITQTASGSSDVVITWTEESQEIVKFRSDPGNYNLYEPVSDLGGFSMQKRDSVTGTTPQGGATLAGAKFQVINNSTNSVKIGDYDEAEPGEVCFEFTVGSTGKYTSAKIFPVGSYIVKEVTAPTGYRLNSTYQGTFTVTGGNTTSLTCNDTVIKGGIKIVKQDAELGADTTENQDLSGITFSVINANANPVVVNGKTYTKDSVIMTLTMEWDATAKQWTANTGTILPYGTYTLREEPMSGSSTLANKQYFLNTNLGTVNVKGNGVTYTATYKNTRASLEVTVSKSMNATTGCINQIKDNSMYSLAGAQYGIYIDGVLQETITTDANGKATSTKKYDLGTQITVKEITAPAGFVLDTTVYSHTIVEGTNSVAVKDVPVFSDFMSLYKVDKDTTNAQGNATFQGVVFKWEYFENYDWSGTASRTWYLKTDANGRVYMTAEHRAEGYDGDDFYLDAGSYRRLPIGSLKITEIVPPTGYAAAGPIYCTITQTESGSSEVVITWTEESQEIIKFRSDPGNYNLYETPDTNTFGGFTLTKKDTELESSAQGGGTLEGAKFQVINKSGNSVKIGDFDEAEPGEVCYEFTVDSTGKFSSGKIFPVGSYIIKEVEAPVGYKLNSTWSESFTVTNGEEEEFICENEIFRGGLTITKYDKDFGEDTGEDALLDGITFDLINANDNPVVVDGKTYQKNETIMTLEIKWNGNIWTATTGPDILPYGKYIVKENPIEEGSDMANEDFLLNTEPQEIEIDSDGKIISIQFENEFKVIPGIVTIHKVDVLGTPLAGAKILLEWSEDGETWHPVEYSADKRPYKGSCATEGITDGWIITDETGTIVFDNLYVGLYYRVSELEAPDGYVLLTDFAYNGELTKTEPEVELSIVNSRGYTLPGSGSNDAYYHAMFGSMLTFSGLMCLAFLLVNNSLSVFNSKKAMNRKKQH